MSPARHSPVALAVGAWPWHGQICRDELRWLEQGLLWLGTLSCSAAALYIPETSHARLDVLDLQLGWDSRYGDNFRTAFTIWMDCRIFAGAPGCKGHSGEHFSCIYVVASHPKFRTWLQQFKNEFTRCLRQVRHGDTMKVVCFCGDGQWRSVACARILAYILRLEENGSPFHLQHYEWADQGVCSEHCDRCESNTCNELKKAALDACEHQWASLFSWASQYLKQRVPPEEQVSGSILDPNLKVWSGRHACDGFSLYER